MQLHHHHRDDSGETIYLLRFVQSKKIYVVFAEQDLVEQSLLGQSDLIHQDMSMAMIDPD
jgi:hypothetical protein